MLQRLEIENFKCFIKKSIDIGRLTVLAGSNSAGKSSVIQSILLSRIAFERLKAVNFVHSSTISVPLNGEYILSLGNTLEVLNREANENIIRFTFNNADNELAKVEFVTEDVESSVFDLHLLACIPENKPFPPFSIFTNQFHYLNAERIGPRLKYEVVAMPYLNVGSQGEYTAQVLSHKKYYVPENRCIDNKQPYELLAQARAWMNFIVPGVSIDDVQLFGKIKVAEISYLKSSPTNVGFGVSYVLPIVVSGLIASEDSLLIIENPEAHLHPSGQSRIGQFLAYIAAAGVQVLVETHSEHVINGIRLATLINTPSPDEVLVNFFSRNKEDKSDVTVIRFTSKGDLEQWPLGFFDQQQQDFAQMIRLKNKIK